MFKFMVVGLAASVFAASILIEPDNANNLILNTTPDDSMLISDCLTGLELSDDDLIDPSITVDENNVIKRGSPPAICRSRENNQKPNPELKVQQPNPNKKDSGSNAKRPCDNPGHTKYWCGGPEVVDPNVPGVFIVVLNCNTESTGSITSRGMFEDAAGVNIYCCKGKSLMREYPDWPATGCYYHQKFYDFNRWSPQEWVSKSTEYMRNNH